MDSHAHLDLWLFFAGLGFFLIGMSFLEKAVKHLSGDWLTGFLRHRTRNTATAIMSGALTTAMLQSSSLVMLIVLSFVSANVIPLKNAVGVILGANIGTTITGWLVTLLGFKLDLSRLVFPLIGTCGLGLMLTQKKSVLGSSIRLLLGFALILFGLQQMKDGMVALSLVYPLGAFPHLSTFGFFAIGFLLTSLIQSSSASMVINLTALSSGSIELHSAAAVAVGSHFGSTMTGFLASIGGLAMQKRLALGHFLYNALNSCLALALLNPLIDLTSHFFGAGRPMLALVAFDTSFNLVGVLAFAPLTKAYTNFLSRRFLKLERRENRKLSGREDFNQKAEQIAHDRRFLVPEAARATLVSERNAFRSEALALLREAMLPAKGWTKAQVKEVEKQYLSAKGHAGLIVQMLGVAQQQDEQAAEISNTDIGYDDILLSVREITHALKAMHDLLHGLMTLGLSPHPGIQCGLKEFREQIDTFFTFVDALQHDPSTASEVWEECQNHTHALDGVLRRVLSRKERNIPTLSLMTFINLLRETHGLERSVVRAFFPSSEDTWTQIAAPAAKSGKKAGPDEDPSKHPHQD